jgi:hypothetical protein
MVLFKRILFILLLTAGLLFCQLDTNGMQTNQWTSIWPVANGLPINGGNWAYENDFAGHPSLPFFILAPGHYVHPQDCYWYPYDPKANKWTKINTPNWHPRS